MEYTEFSWLWLASSGRLFDGVINLWGLQKLGFHDHIQHCKMPVKAVWWKWFVQVQNMTWENWDPHSSADDSGIMGYCALLTDK